MLNKLEELEKLVGAGSGGPSGDDAYSMWEMLPAILAELKASRSLVEAIRNFGRTKIACFVCGDEGDGCDCDPDESDRIEREAALAQYEQQLKEV